MNTSATGCAKRSPEEKENSEGGAGEKFGVLRRIWLKVRYGSVIQECLERAGKLGFKVELYYLLRENGLNPVPGDYSHPKGGGEDYETGFLGREEMMAIARVPGGGVTENQVREWFDDGRTCFGLKQGGKILSYVWCNFRECRYLGLRIPLKDDEAYLFNTQTLRSHRGRNLAGLVRARLYRELSGRGMVHYYNVVSVFNRPSLRVKKKLGARKVKVFLYVGLTGIGRRTYRLMTFER